MKFLSNLLLFASIIIGCKGENKRRQLSSKWSQSDSSPPPHDGDFCDCYNIDLVCSPYANAAGEMCYYYQIERISDSDCCKPIEYISLGFGNLDECGLQSIDIQQSLLDYAPKCFQVDPLYDGKSGVPGIKVTINPYQQQQG